MDDFQEKVSQKLIDTYGNEFKLPDYTIKDIREAIPKHCFERSAARGLYYVARDIVLLGTTFYLFNKFCTPEYVPSYALRAALWAGYTFVQGLFGTGLWVLAHECGHQSFSPSKTLNDTVGWFCHSALLVPYFSWKISHGKHHKATGNLERDMVFVPRTREQHATKMGYLVHEMHELMEETPIYTAATLLGQQLAGWPLYLIENLTGHNNHAKQPEGKGVGKKNGDGSVNHFLPSSPLYEKKDEHLILLSDLGLLITATALFLVGRNFGFTNLLVWYFLPYMWVNHWLGKSLLNVVLPGAAPPAPVFLSLLFLQESKLEIVANSKPVAITYLQHTDPTLPHYTGSTWNFARGAAATIDREFGFIGRQLFHGIIETHVLHHYISTIPFYHADEASEAIKPVMGEHYRANVEGGSLGFLNSLWQSARWCQWVEPSDNPEVYFYRNRNGLGAKPAKYPAPGQAAPTRPIALVEDDSE